MTEFKVRRKSQTNEWVVVVSVNGKRNEARCYYTNDRTDADNTAKAMRLEDQRAHLVPNQLVMLTSSLLKRKK